MRNKNVLGVVLAAMLLAGLATGAPAALNPGTYDLLEAFSDTDPYGGGSWQENLFGGGHGAIGNIVTAWGGSGGDGWQVVAQLVATPVASDKAGYDWKTGYRIGDDPDSDDVTEFGFALVSSRETSTGTDGWGESIEILDADAFNYSKKENGRLAFLFTFTGFDKDNPGIPITIEAEFDSIGDPNVQYWDNTVNGFSHGGNPFKRLTMVVAPIPGAVWLLGSGLVGLVALRRKRT